MAISKGICELTRGPMAREKRKAEDFSSAFPACTLPRYFANLNLLQRGDGVVAGTDRVRTVGTKHGVRERAELTNTSLVGNRGRRDELIGRGRSSGHARQSNRVAALDTRLQLLVDQASAGGVRRCAGGAAEGDQRTG